jgi:hypothetical protein
LAKRTAIPYEFMELLQKSYLWVGNTCKRKIGTLNNNWVKEGVEENGRLTPQAREMHSDLLISPFYTHQLMHKRTVLKTVQFRSLQHTYTNKELIIYAATSVAYSGIFCGGGSTISVEDRGQNGDLGAVAPYSGVLEAAVIWYNKFRFI